MPPVRLFIPAAGIKFYLAGIERTWERVLNWTAGMLAIRSIQHLGRSFMKYMIAFVLVAAIGVATLIILGIARSSTIFGAAIERPRTQNADKVEPALLASDLSASSSDIDKFISAENAQPAPEIAAGDWINTGPLTLGDLRGRVVMLDFWTFGCYNCRNTLPTVKRLDTTFRDKGLTIIGVHTPESDYERNLNTLRSTVDKLGIKYSVVTDINYRTWDAYGVQAWPTIVILDKEGRIRYTHIGEGAYETQEQVIRSLLGENH